jgi:exodeoxyribonuclease VII small subunit
MRLLLKSRLFEAHRLHKLMTTATNKKPSYESAIAELESIVTQLESGQLPLEQSLAVYQRGAELIKLCQQSLADIEQKVSILTEANTLATYQPASE